MTAAPQRIQLSRRRGYNLQAQSRRLNGLAAVNCGRPTRWGNPFRVVDVVGGIFVEGPGYCASFPDRDSAVRQAVASYRANLLRGSLGYTVEDVKRELRGYNLACWCALPAAGETDWCHAATLLWYASCEDERLAAEHEDAGG